MSFVSPIIETTDWKAWANLELPGPFSLHVTGKVKLRSGDYTLNLVQVTPDGSDSRSTLYLRIIVSGSGMTDDVVVKDVSDDVVKDVVKDVSFVLNDYKQGTYKDVEILSTTNRIDEIKEAH